jgi:hypothetical protein
MLFWLGFEALRLPYARPVMTGTVSRAIGAWQPISPTLRIRVCPAA